MIKTVKQNLNLQTIVRGDHGVMPVSLTRNGIPKTSHVARSNSLRSSSPVRMRGDIRAGANVPPSVPEGEVLHLPQYPSARRDIPYVSTFLGIV